MAEWLDPTASQPPSSSCTPMWRRLTIPPFVLALHHGYRMFVARSAYLGTTTRHHSAWPCQRSGEILSVILSKVPVEMRAACGTHMMLHTQDLGQRCSSNSNGAYQAVGFSKRCDAETQVLEQYISQIRYQRSSTLLSVPCINPTLCSFDR